MLFDIVLLRKQRTGVGPSDAASVEKDRRESQGGCRLQYARKPSVLHPRGHGSARRDPLRDKIREVGRGLSLADTQTGCCGQLYSRRRLCARRDADALGRRSSDPSLDFQQLLRLLVFGRCVSKTYRYRYFANTVYVTVSRVNAYSGGVLARALPEGLRYLST